MFLCFTKQKKMFYSKIFRLPGLLMLEVKKWNPPKACVCVCMCVYKGEMERVLLVLLLVPFYGSDLFSFVLILVGNQ